MNELPMIVRGTTYPIGGFYKDQNGNTDITGATIYFTMKNQEWDNEMSDSSAVVQKTVTSFPDATGGQYAIELTPSDTKAITPQTYNYDIKIKLASGSVFLLVEGRVKVDGSPTNRSA